MNEKVKNIIPIRVKKSESDTLMKQWIKSQLETFSFKQVMSSSSLFIQFYYALRILWWGFAAYFLNYNFVLRYMDYLMDPFYSIPMFVIGILGVIGVFFRKYYLNIFFSIFTVFIFVKVAISFSQFAPGTVAGLNYSIEAAAAIWLAYRVQKDKITTHDKILNEILITKQV